MSTTRRRLAPAFVAALTTAAFVALTPAAIAAQPKLGPTSQLIGFNIKYGQLPENLTTAPNGALDVVLNGAGEVVHVSSSGALTVLAQLPAPADKGVNTPILKEPFTAGIVRATDGTVYTLYSTGNAALNGVWRISPGQTATRIIPLPANSLANGLAFSPNHRDLFITDSALGVIWEAPTAGGTAKVWAKGKALEGTTSFGANGLKVHAGALWVSNTQNGTILEIPIAANGKVGEITVAARGLTTVDDFQFVGSSDEIVAALNKADEVALVAPNGTHRIVLTAANGLEGPSSIAVSGNTVYVASAGYYTGTNPNILVTHISG